MTIDNLSNKIPSKISSIILSKIVVLFLWLLFLSNLLYVALYFPNIPSNEWGGILRINGFTMLLWTVVTFFSAVISSYALNYLKGFKYQNRFMALCLGFTFCVMLLVMSDHVLLLFVSWLLMGLFMANLIGIDSDWLEAREASKFARRHFVAGTFFLGFGILLLVLNSNVYTISGLTSTISTMPTYIVFIAALCIILSAIIQSAMFPFQRWLLSAMTAPTPASALMHAGFVNGGGIILTIFAPILLLSNTLNLLFIIGGLTAIIAQFTKLIQVNVKQRLACSTIAQMGFMIMQCGLGFFNAAIAHLILHGFYKAYLFLSSGDGIENSKPQQPLQIKIKPFQVVIVLFFGLLGAMLFVLLTGKGTDIDSGIFLTLIVAITMGQATYNVLKEQTLSILQKAVIPIVVFMVGIIIYALTYNTVSLLMSDMPSAVFPLQLTFVQILFGVIFLLGFFIMKLGIYRKLPWLYVKLLNASQPCKNSILLYKSKFNE